MLRFYVFTLWQTVMASLADSKDAVLVTQGTLKNENKILVQATPTINAGASTTWNLATILDTEAAKYDFSTIDIEVYVVDNDNLSPTKGYYVRADAIAGIGFKTNGTVIVSNQYDTAQTFMVRIRVTKKANA